MADDDPIFSGGLKPRPDTGRSPPKESNEGIENNVFSGGTEPDH